MHKIFTIVSLTTILILIRAAISIATWQVNIEVSTPDPNSDTGIASNKLSIGTDPSATGGYDSRFDTLALLGTGLIQAYLPHTEYPQNQQKLWRDFRKDSLPQEWEIEVESSKVNSPIKIDWEINAPDNLNFNLLDIDNGQEIDMAVTTDYSYSNSSTMSKKFLLKVTENAGISSSGSSGGGGGCGYIRNTERKDDPMNEHGQIALNMIILIAPLLLTFQYH